MCDYSLHTARSRPARVGDRLVTHNFNTGTRGFAAPEDARTAVCVLPGTELAFDKELQSARIGVFGWKVKTSKHTTAIFRQINKIPHGHLARRPRGGLKQAPASPMNAAERSKPRNLRSLRRMPDDRIVQTPS